MFKKISLYILILLAIGAIMYLTVMKLDDTVYLSESFRTTVNTVCGRLGLDTSSEWWNSGAGIRLVGHVIEYFALGLVVGIAVKWKIVGLIVCMAISLIDQTVKIFIPARHFDWGDIPFDIIGFCCGLAIAWVVRFAIRKEKEIGNG